MEFRILTLWELDPANHDRQPLMLSHVNRRQGLEPSVNYAREHCYNVARAGFD